MADVELHDEIVDWMSSLASLSGPQHDGSLTDSTDNRIILLTTFRKQRNNERAEIARARKIADECARLNP